MVGSAVAAWQCAAKKKEKKRRENGGGGGGIKRKKISLKMKSVIVIGIDGRNGVCMLRKAEEENNENIVVAAYGNITRKRLALCSGNGGDIGMRGA